MLNLALLTLTVMALSHSGSAQEKLATCCKKVDVSRLTEPIIDYLVQKAHKPCVEAVIFQTESGLYCKHLKAPWVQRKIMAFRKNKVSKAKAEVVLSSATPSAPVSLLSILTSTLSPSSSSPSPALSDSSESYSSTESSTEQYYD